jgi:hypothetical protein
VQLGDLFKVLNLPAGHTVQIVAPAKEYFPTVQTLEHDKLPVDAKYVPGSHRLQ